MEMGHLPSINQKNHIFHFHDILTNGRSFKFMYGCIMKVGHIKEFLWYLRDASSYYFNDQVKVVVAKWLFSILYENITIATMIFCCMMMISTLFWKYIFKIIMKQGITTQEKMNQ